MAGEKNKNSVKKADKAAAQVKKIDNDAVKVGNDGINKNSAKTFGRAVTSCIVRAKLNLMLFVVFFYVTLN